MEILNLNLTGDFMDTQHDMINSLAVISESFKKYSLNPKVYNTQFGLYLEQMANQMEKDKIKLEYEVSYYGDI